MTTVTNYNWNKLILRKYVIPLPVYCFVTYLMEYGFAFTFASREFP